MSLLHVLQDIEKQVGLFSKKYKTINAHNHYGLTQDIPFDNKPAQQVLTQLGGASDQKAILSIRTSVTLPTDGLVIKDFMSNQSPNTLIIANKCIPTLLDNAKIYVNTTLFPEGLYAKTLAEKKITSHDKHRSEETNTYWQNMAVGICHAQIIYPLVSSIINKNNKSITTPADGHILERDPGILLLSSPRLQFKDGVAKKLTSEQQTQHIEGMYRNLFQATLSEGRNYLAMPAAGLGSTGGACEAYFSALMKVAKEFPELNIIYHPSAHGKEFDNALKKSKLTNVVKATKDIIRIADLLTQQGNLCALHNPSETDVVYGLCDVGGHWKTGKNKHFTMQEYIGTMTTAPLNSIAFNPLAYQTIVENRLTSERLPIPISPTTETPSTQPTSTDSTLPNPSPIVLPDVPVIPSESSPQELPIPSQPSPIGTNPNGIFTPETEQKYALDIIEILAIDKTIHCLQREIDSFWPYPNKDVKQIKIDALNLLKHLADTKPIEEAIAQVKQEYPRVDEGRISTRTSDLLASLIKNKPNNTIQGQTI